MRVTVAHDAGPLVTAQPLWEESARQRKVTSIGSAIALTVVCRLADATSRPENPPPAQADPPADAVA